MCRHSFFHSGVLLLVADVLTQGTLHSQGYTLLQAIVNSLLKWKYVDSKIHGQWMQNRLKNGGLQNGQMQSYESKIHLTINLMFQ